MEVDSEILVEVIDKNGQLLKSQVYSIGDDVDTKVISIDITSNTPPGECIVTIIGVASQAPDGSAIPGVWQNVPNFRWTRIFTAKTDSPNKSPIIYGTNKPSIRIDEIKKPFYLLAYNQELSGSDNSNYWNGNITSSYVLSSDGFGEAKNTNSKVTYRKSGDKYYITAQPESGQSILDFGGFTKDMEGGILIVRNPQTVRPSSVNGYTAAPVFAPEEEGDGLFENTTFTNNTASFVTGAYVTTVAEVISPFEVRTSTPHTTLQGLTSAQYQNFEHFEFGESDFELMWSQMPVSYSASPTGSTGAPLNTSYAHVKFNNLEPLTGDVTRIKCYIKNHQAPFDWMLASDNAVEANELLYRDDFEKYRYPIGDFTQYGVAHNGTASLNTYWTASGVGTANPSLGIYRQSDSNENPPVMDCLVVGDNNQALQLDDTAFWWVQPLVTASFYQDQWYELSFKAVSQRTQIPSWTSANNNAIEDPKLSVYMSGSAFVDGGDDYGKFIGLIEDTAVKKKHIDFDRMQNEVGRKFVFRADGTEGAMPKFKIDSGIWYIWDVSIKPWDRVGFTPGSWDVIFQTIKCNVANYDSLDFRFEFYNDYGDIANYTAIVPNVPWQNELTATFTNVVTNTISGSTGSFGNVNININTGPTTYVNGPFIFTGSISTTGPNTFGGTSSFTGPTTFSGGISASGPIYLGDNCLDTVDIYGTTSVHCLTTQNNNIVTYNTTTKRLHYSTASTNDIGSGTGGTGGADNLGNHVASQSLFMDEYWITSSDSNGHVWFNHNGSNKNTDFGQVYRSGDDVMIFRNRKSYINEIRAEDTQGLTFRIDTANRTFGQPAVPPNQQPATAHGGMQMLYNNRWYYYGLRYADTNYNVKYNNQTGEITFFRETGIGSGGSGCMISKEYRKAEVGQLGANWAHGTHDPVEHQSYIACGVTIGPPGKQIGLASGYSHWNNFSNAYDDTAWFMVNGFNSFDCPDGAAGALSGDGQFLEQGVMYSAIFNKCADPVGVGEDNFDCEQAGAGHGIKIATSTIPRSVAVKGGNSAFMSVQPGLHCVEGQGADATFGNPPQLPATPCGLPNAFYISFFHREAVKTSYGAFMIKSSYAGGVRKHHSNFKTQVIYETVSDRRLKTNIKDSNYGLDDLLQIPVRSFEWKATPVSEGGTRTTGFIAQEVQPVYPEAVVGTEEWCEEPEKQPIIMDYNTMIPLLVQSVQDQQKIIEKLTKRIEQLENR